MPVFVSVRVIKERTPGVDFRGTIAKQATTAWHMRPFRATHFRRLWSKLWSNSSFALLLNNRNGLEFWSWWCDSNPQPTFYKFSALSSLTFVSVHKAGQDHSFARVSVH